MTLATEVERAICLMLESKRMVVLSGAGTSTASGIPDFRSRETGLWSKTDAFAVASIYGFRLWPDRFYDWVRPLARKVREAEPNAAHLAISRLEEQGLVASVITQNVDGLHQAAGSRRVLELHGTFRLATCTKCSCEVSTEPMMECLIEGREVPHCPECAGILKPNVVLIGEQLPLRTYLEAEAESELCDLMLVTGSSLSVTPAADLPLVALQHGAELIIINLQPTPLDSSASLVICRELTEVLPPIVDGVLKCLSRSDRE
jgi:NAD-dependent deacetylase